ncbi:MAG: glycoside hydrolase, partial [Clostridia bacterium]|nr:glycoside hydrolase [Clostridia bacterium]
MHARTGLITEYLSDEWMTLIRACAEYADELGMKAWAYDENGWPSGFAGGKLLEREENRDKYLLYSVGEYMEDANVRYFADGEELIKTDRNVNGRTYLNLYIKTSNSNADILNKDVVDQFISLTHEKYRSEMKGDFSRKIQGFFTDEPQYQRSHTPFTDTLIGYFREKYNSDIFEQLGLLFLEKKGYREFRYRYWSALQDLMLHSFAETVYDWCNKNGIGFTGHYI